MWSLIPGPSWFDMPGVQEQYFSPGSPGASAGNTVKELTVNLKFNY